MKTSLIPEVETSGKEISRGYATYNADGGFFSTSRIATTDILAWGFNPMHLNGFQPYASKK